MIEHAHGFGAAGIPYVFDPGQGLPMFSGEELLDLLAGASALTVNDYEARVVEQRTGKSVAQIARSIDAVVVTKAGEGSTVHTRSGTVDIPAVKATAVVDPTGCGDAYRAGHVLSVDRA